MANKIYIQILNEIAVYEFPLLDDVTVEAQSQMQSWGELLPGLGDVVNFGTMLASGQSSVGAGMLALFNAFDMPRWSKTDPVKIQTKLMFYTKTDSYADVFLPTARIVGLSILSKTSDNNFSVPGLGLHNMNLVQRQFSSIDSAYKKKTLSSQYTYGAKTAGKQVNIENSDATTKIISLEIPGMIYLPAAMVLGAVPTFSKQITEAGYPLWASVDFQCCSLVPAMDYMFLGAKSSAEFFKKTQQITSPVGSKGGM